MGEKTFSSYVKNSKIYTLIAVGLASSISWAESIIIPKIAMGLSIFTVQIKIISTITVRKIFVYGISSLIKLIFYQVEDIKVRPIIVANIMRQIFKFLGSTFIIPYIYVGNVFRQSLRILGNILKIPKIILVGIMTVAVFNILSIFDPQDFNVLDNMILQNMDYTL